jgi:hypothetical protein
MVLVTSGSNVTEFSGMVHGPDGVVLGLAGLQRIVLVAGGWLVSPSVKASPTLLLGAKNCPIRDPD